MLNNIPTSVKWAIGIVIVIALLAVPLAVSAYLDAATALLPGGKG